MTTRNERHACAKDIVTDLLGSHCFSVDTESDSRASEITLSNLETRLFALELRIKHFCVSIIQDIHPFS